MFSFALIILLIVLAEIKARKDYLKKHSIPFEPKKVGEYPYNEFIDECGPPLHWRLKQGYASKQVHINSLGQRGPEPQPGKRKIWVAGESELFGAKLPEEQHLWLNVLQNRLDEAGYDYQVMNASIIGYNGQQTAEAVTALPIGPGDILLIRPNMNDLSIAVVNGKDWEPGTPWPMAFIHKLQSHKPWYQKALDQTCLGTALRKKWMKSDERQKAFASKPGFQQERVFEESLHLLRRMTAYARERGADVAMFDYVFSYEAEVNPEDEAKLSAIQSNWRFYIDKWSTIQFALQDFAVDRFAVPEGLPVLRLAPYIWKHPRRYQMFIDIVHFNAEGHTVYAQALYNELRDKKIIAKDT
ncbi:hypothetical protein [Desulfoplanes formicivorans]|uniref:SGNH hydrolase-type esterase domain-containing protein n=1 Tax=Desulfoplanes formicivorans TaxID=1592317 RepID=A0A194AH45_9BACT|nr:hypothetical protein [Desulfoplanes formicivorans]GAU08535.1 hypothetical protein DPF_1247 [Desulfoplanes formicivorans]